MIEYPLVTKVLNGRVRNADNVNLSIALAGFIAGVSLTEALRRIWPHSATLLLVGAATIAFLHTLRMYWQLRRSEAEYKRSLAEMREADPVLADLIERNLP